MLRSFNAQQTNSAERRLANFRRKHNSDAAADVTDVAAADAVLSQLCRSVRTMQSKMFFNEHA